MFFTQPLRSTYGGLASGNRRHRDASGFQPMAAAH
jgi:hypothetical protein